MWAKNPWMLIFFFFCHWKRGGEGQKSIISVWNWVCLGNAENSKSQGCASSKAMRWHPGSHWALHPLPAPCGCLSFVPIWICCFVGSAPTLGFAQGNSKGRSGNIEGYRWSLHTCSHQEPRTDVLDPTSPFLCSHYQETTQPWTPKEVHRNWRHYYTAKWTPTPLICSVSLAS